MTEQTFQQVVQQHPVDIVQAALSFAREIVYPALVISTYTERIAELLDEARASFLPTLNLAERAELLADILFIQDRIRGNVSRYYVPDNSDLRGRYSGKTLMPRKIKQDRSRSCLFIYLVVSTGL